MPDPIASATELTVRYGPHTVLDRATIAIEEGDRVGLVGRNGCGKSTFLRIAGAIWLRTAEALRAAGI